MTLGDRRTSEGLLLHSLLRLPAFDLFLFKPFCVFLLDIYYSKADHKCKSQRPLWATMLSLSSREIHGTTSWLLSNQLHWSFFPKIAFDWSFDAVRAAMASNLIATNSVRSLLVAMPGAPSSV